MNNATREQFQARFQKCMNVLRALGFKGECLVTAGAVTINAADKASASMIRKGFKQLRSAGVMTETRNKQTGGALFIHVLPPEVAQADAAAA